MLFGFFRPFSRAALAGLAAAARWRVFTAGQTVLEAGDPARDVYFIADGEVRVIIRSSGGHEIIMNELGPGQSFGEIASVDGGTTTNSSSIPTSSRPSIRASELLPTGGTSCTLGPIGRMSR